MHFLLPDLFTINKFLLLNLLPKSRDSSHIRSYVVDLMVHIDHNTEFNVMDFIIETMKRTCTELKRSCCYAPYIQRLINHKVGEHTFKLECKHKEITPSLEDHTISLVDENAPRPRVKIAKSKDSPTTSTADAPSTSALPPPAAQRLPPLRVLRVMVHNSLLLVPLLHGLSKE